MIEADTDRPPLGVRMLYRSVPNPDWPVMTYDQLLAYRAAENRKRASRLARVITGFPDREVAVEWQAVTLPDRSLTVRVYRPRRQPRRRSEAALLPLVLHVHGGGFVGTAAQCDWANSHFAAQLPAVVVSVEHRLLDHRTPLAAAFDDGWDGLESAVRDGCSRWGADRDRVAVVGESTGALITALTAIRAKWRSLPLRAQVLVNPVVDLTAAGLEVPSMKRHSTSAALNLGQLQLLQRLAVPAGTDPRTLSPMYADLSGLAPALLVVPTVDPLADQGRAYAGRLSAAGTAAHLLEYPRAPHAFLTMPGLVRAARTARAEILGFLRERLPASGTSR